MQSSRITYRDVRLSQPFEIANGTITSFTLVIVELTCADRTGKQRTGRGASVLSVPWSWPRSSLAVRERDSVMRKLALSLTEATKSAGFADPIEHWQHLSALLITKPAGLHGWGRIGESIPHLALTLPLGAVDNALHDAWSRLAERPAWSMYDATFLNADLSSTLGPEFKGTFPSDHLRGSRQHLPVQHVISPADPLDDLDPLPGRPLSDWIRSEQLSHLKIKLAGSDGRTDAQRIAQVFRVARAVWPDTSPELAIDPNESHPDPGTTLRMLDRLRRIEPDALAATRYIEQPTPRAAPSDPAGMAELSARVPVLLDEGLSGLDDLTALRAEGWSGSVIKAAKGQTLALLAHSFLCQFGLFVTIQDLTAVDLALRHSARLAGVLNLSAPQFEYNSRQYAPHANAELARTDPEIVKVRGGRIGIGDAIAPGLY
ncbi:enolase C-terminal domain-like protein [Kribbella sp. NPDC050459]|uniref:enolase C-terminal domain-like protein n=1 Tax=Kribbella sp. NPDC050459 TaxID=3155785 RepID=UPI00340A51CB